MTRTAVFRRCASKPCHTRLSQLILLEDDYTDPRCDPEGRRSDAERYAGWMEQGRTPPPIAVNELATGALAVVNGHRRVAAAKMVRQTIQAWISWLIDTDSRDHAGTPHKTALTYELARKVLLSSAASPTVPGGSARRSAAAGVSFPG